jgi:hypothetical protein
VTVGELIEKLKEFPEDAIVECSGDNGGFPLPLEYIDSFVGIGGVIIVELQGS